MFSSLAYFWPKTSFKQLFLSLFFVLWHYILTDSYNVWLLFFFQSSPISDFVLETIQQNVAHQWIQSKREEIIDQMTEACLNQSLDALLSRFLLMKEDYELISTKPTRTSKVRQLLDTSDSQGEEFARIIIQKLKDNKQLGLQPYPDIVSNSLRLQL